MAYKPLIDLRLESRNPGEVPKLKIFGEQDEGSIPPAVEQPAFNMTQPQAPEYVAPGTTPLVTPVIPNLSNIVSQGANPVAPVTAPAVNEGMIPSPITQAQPQPQQEQFTTSKQTTTVKGIGEESKEVQDAKAEANQKAQDAILSAQIAGETRAAEETAFAKRQKELLEQQIKDDAALKQKQDDEYLSATGKRDEAVKSASEAKVDPGRFFKNKGTWAQLGAALAIGLGAYASSITKGPNYALDIINNAIDKDIESQKIDIQQQWKGVDQKTNALSELTKQFGDQRLAASVLKEQQFQALQADLNNKLGSTKSAELQAKIAEMQANLSQRQAEQKAQTEALAKDKVQETKTEQLVQKDTVALNKAETEAQQNWNNDERVKEANKLAATSYQIQLYLKDAMNGDEAAKNALKGILAKKAQGGTGVLSDSDMKVFGLNSSLLGRLNSFIKTGTLGEMTDAEKKYVENDVNRTKQELRNLYKDAYQDRSALWIRQGMDPRVIAPVAYSVLFDTQQNKKSAAPKTGNIKK